MKHCLVNVSSCLLGSFNRTTEELKHYHAEDDPHDVIAFNRTTEELKQYQQGVLIVGDIAFNRTTEELKRSK